MAAVLLSRLSTTRFPRSTLSELISSVPVSRSPRRPSEPPRRVAPMPDIAAIVPEEQRSFLSSLSPGPAQKRLALACRARHIGRLRLDHRRAAFGLQTRRIDAFLPAYLTAMFVCDSITAILLFAQFSILRSRAILVIASGISLHRAHPDPVCPGVSRRVCRRRRRSAGCRAPAWLYVLWHCGFPLFVIAMHCQRMETPANDFEAARRVRQSPRVSP